MVGTVVYKDFETGSYRYMRITVYNGSGYTDIGNGEFFSCRVCLEEKNIITDYEAKEGAPCRSMSDIMNIAASARSFLLENQYVTAAEFCLNHGECRLRPISFKVGVYEPPDFQCLFNNGGFYKLVFQNCEETPLYRSVLCEGINCALQLLCGISERVYSFAGYGVYVNMAVFSKDALKAMGVDKRLCRAATSKNTSTIDFGKTKTMADFEKFAPGIYSGGILIRDINEFKLSCMQRTHELFGKCTSLRERAECVCSLPEDTCINEYSAHLTEELASFASQYHDMGYIEAKSHAFALTLREIMHLSRDSKDTGCIKKTALARSVNTKFLNKLPAAPFYDSDGRAIWDLKTLPSGGFVL